MNSVASRRASLWLAIACVLTAAIVYFSLSRTIISIPGDAGGRFGHMAAYAGLMFMLARTCETTRSRVIVAAALVAVGVVIEFLQARTGYRNYEHADMAANAVGIALGWFTERRFAAFEWPRGLLPR